MKTAPPLSTDEAERLRRPLEAALRMAVLNSGCAAGAAGVIEDGRLRLLATVGLPGDVGGAPAFFCAASLFDGDGPVVLDPRTHPGFAGSLLLAMDPPPAFFAAMPVEVRGRCVGAVCVIDAQARTPGSREVDALRDAATLCAALLEGPLRRSDTHSPANEKLYRAVAQTLSDGLYVVDAECRILATNPAGCEILGVEAAQIVGASLDQLGFELLFEDGSTVTEIDHPVRRVMRGGAALVGRAHRLRRPDDTQRLVQLSVQPLHGDSAELPDACLVSLRDVTRQREAEQGLRDRQAADIANRAKNAFLSRVSHEMRTPLNAVIGFTQLLRLSPDANEPAQVAQYTDHVLRASEHLLALINDLLDLQRVDDGRLALRMKALPLGELVDATFALLQPLAGQHGVVLQNQVARNAWVRADAQRLRQVLLNITSNAIKYNRSGGWVRISLLPGDAQQWVLAVEDTGSGLSQAQLARLFQPFERLGQESSEIAGSGLGLVIARRLVEAMDGQLTLSSVPTAGTQVRIALPRTEVPEADAAARRNAPPVPAAEPAAAATAATTAPAAPASLRMLYVEDNRINAILFEEAVRMLGGVELQVAEDGAAALALVEEWHPDVLVLDANLPDMSGYDVLTHLRKRPTLADVPAFMCSADAMDEDVRRATAAGFVGYWTKPIDLTRVMGDLDRLRLRPAAAA